MPRPSTGREIRVGSIVEVRATPPGLSKMPRDTRRAFRAIIGHRLKVRGATEIEDHPNSLGLRSKLGGVPDWEQLDETPHCQSCGETMSFVGQLDSFEHDYANNPHRIDALSGEQHFMFGDVGIIYIFFCFDCSEPKAVFQCG